MRICKNKILAAALLLAFAAPCFAQVGDDYTVADYRKATSALHERLPGNIICYYGPDGDKRYDLWEYIDVATKRGNASLSFVRGCCEAGRTVCRESFYSLYDGNVLTLAAAERNSLDILRIFVTERGFAVDKTWRRQPVRNYYDKAGRSELMHAIYNGNLPMVKFLLGQETEQHVSVDGTMYEPNKTRLSNPKRRAPHTDDKYFFNHDALDFARLLKDKTPDGLQILAAVEAAWQTAPEWTMYDEDDFLVDDEAGTILKKVFMLIASAADWPAPLSVPATGLTLAEKGIHDELVQNLSETLYQLAVPRILSGPLPLRPAPAANAAGKKAPARSKK